MTLRGAGSKIPRAGVPPRPRPPFQLGPRLWSVSFVVTVEAKAEATAEFWPDWQGEIIHGRYQLGRLLNASEFSAVFATESVAQVYASAAIKIVCAERVTLAQLSYWRTAADLSHPHLVRIFDAGLCQRGASQFLFVVTEYAEQTLAQVLLQRPLTGEEVQEMLPPAVDALAYLHGRNLVQGQLEPASILAVNDQLKLATDTVRPIGEPRANLAQGSFYDPPEAQGGRLSPAGDIWALGMTMVEALTQRAPSPSDAKSALQQLPGPLAPALVELLQRCLSDNAASRPAALELDDQFKRVPQERRLDVAQRPADEPATRIPASPAAGSSRLFARLVVVVLILLAGSWAGLRLFRSTPTAQRPAVKTVETGPQSNVLAPAPRMHLPAPAASTVPVPTPTGSKLARSPPVPSQHQAPQPAPVLPVIHEQLPSVPRSALATIHGHVKVGVLVIVDPSGNVVDALAQNPGPSAYFARLAKEAARQWKFVPADGQDSREWLLRFEFTRSGATARAEARRP